MPEKPFCPLFGRCGGCSLQDKSCDEQLSLKGRDLSTLFARDVAVRPSPQGRGYRSRMDFILAEGMVGLRPAGKSLEVVDVPSCPLLPRVADECYAEARRLVLASGLSFFDQRTKRGLLRYLTIRTVSDGECMLILTTTTPEGDEEGRCSSVLKKLSGLAASVYWFVDDKPRDDAVKGALRLQLGKECLRETIDGLSYRIGPQTFFQSNRGVAELLVKQVGSVVDGRTLDLFCGVGLLSIAVAKKALAVVGVEHSSESVAQARLNALDNGVRNASFIAEPALEYVKHSLIAKERFDTVVVDPPRTGLGVDLTLALRALCPQKIVYVSCNPKTLRDDLELLRKAYIVFSLDGYDMFPQTSHVECLAVMQRR